MSDFPDGWAVVLGGSGGIGRACAIRIAECGADVVVTYRSNRDKAEGAAEEIRALGRRALCASVDVGDADAVTAFFAGVAERGRVHSVVYAVGSDITQPRIADVTAEQWRQVIDADLNGLFHTVSASLGHLRAGGGGSYVLLSSAGLGRFPPGDILSVAPKASMEALLVGVAREEGRNNIRANSVGIGVIEAGIFERLQESEFSEKWMAAARNNTALKRFGSARELADVVTFLASSRASYVTGQTIMVDGGYTL